MDHLKQKLDAVLEKTLEGVIEILGAAAKSRDHATMDRALALVEKLRDIDTEVNAGAKVAESASPVYKKSRSNKRKKPPKKGEYPIYKVANGSLFKTGWSKKKGDEYVHRVPISTVRNISGALELLSAAPGPISGEEILASDLVKNVGNIPSYQGYVTLAFLKDRGIISSTGREGYRLPPNIESSTRKLLRQEEEAA